MIEYPDGNKYPYFTVSYANGPGYAYHYKGADNANANPWKNPNDLTEAIEDVNFLHPAMTPGPDNSETHGGEDVGIYATGPMAHLLSGVHEQSFIADVMAYSACVGRFASDSACDKSERSSAAAATVSHLALLLAAAAVMTAGRRNP